MFRCTTYLLTDLVKFQEEQTSIGGSLADSDTGMLQIPYSYAFIK